MTNKCASWYWFMVHTEVHQEGAPQLLGGRCLMLFKQPSPSHSIHMMGHIVLEIWQRVAWSSCLLYTGLVPPNDIVNSKCVVGVNLGDSGVVIGYHIGEFTGPWSVECFVSHSQNYPWFTGKVSALIHFPLEPSFEDYTLSDHAVEEFDHNLDSILIDFTEHCHWMHPFMTLMLSLLLPFPGSYIWLVPLITFKLQLTPSIKSHKLLCEARALISCIIGGKNGSLWTYLLHLKPAGSICILDFHSAR